VIGYHGSIEEQTEVTPDVLRVLYSVSKPQLVLMSVEPIKEIGGEITNKEKRMTYHQATFKKKALAADARSSKLREQSFDCHQAHDIKNIVSAVAMIADELGGEIEPRSRILGDRLERACKRIQEICTAELRLDCDATKDDSTLGSLLDDVMELAKPLKAPDVVLRTLCENPDVLVPNAPLVFRILANLVTNAVGVVDPRSGSVMLLAEVRNGAIEIDICDNGPGFLVKSKTVLPQENVRRTGIGLTVAELMAKRAGVQLELLSTDSSGTSFRASVPLGYRPSTQKKSEPNESTKLQLAARQYAIKKAPHALTNAS
jgi:signal transduction histidine kinase